MTPCDVHPCRLGGIHHVLLRLPGRAPEWRDLCDEHLRQTQTWLQATPPTPRPPVLAGDAPTGVPFLRGPAARPKVVRPPAPPIDLDEDEARIKREQALARARAARPAKPAPKPTPKPAPKAAQPPARLAALPAAQRCSDCGELLQVDRWGEVCPACDQAAAPPAGKDLVIQAEGEKLLAEPAAAAPGRDLVIQAEGSSGSIEADPPVPTSGEGATIEPCPSPAFIATVLRNMREPATATPELDAATQDQAPAEGCRVDGCTAAPRWRGLCRVHYHRLLRAGTLEQVAAPATRGRYAPPPPAAQAGEPGCRIDGCASAARLRGLCTRHYDAYRMKGRLEEVALPKAARRIEQACSEPGCTDRGGRRGLCRRHYDFRLRQGTLPEAPPPPPPPASPSAAAPSEPAAGAATSRSEFEARDRLMLDLVRAAETMPLERLQRLVATASAPEPNGQTCVLSVEVEAELLVEILAGQRPVAFALRSHA